MTHNIKKSSILKIIKSRKSLHNSDCYSIFRLTKALEELTEFLKAEDELKETKEFVAAQAVIEAAKAEIN